MTNIASLILREEQRLASLDPVNRINVLSTLMVIKSKNNQKESLYVDFKTFITDYIHVVKSADYGYDSFNFDIILKLLKLVNSKERISLLLFTMSCLSRDLPEHDRNWFVSQRRMAEIEYIFRSHKYHLFPKAILLCCNHNILSLGLSLILIYLIPVVVLLPTETKSRQIFEIKYASFCSNFWLNHLINVLAIFANIDDTAKVVPRTGLAIIIIVIAKLLFAILILNFLYIKLIEKITNS